MTILGKAALKFLDLILQLLDPLFTVFVSTFKRLDLNFQQVIPMGKLQKQRRAPLWRGVPVKFGDLWKWTVIITHSSHAGIIPKTPA